MLTNCAGGGGGGVYSFFIRNNHRGSTSITKQISLQSIDCIIFERGFLEGFCYKTHYSKLKNTTLYTITNHRLRRSLQMKDYHHCLQFSLFPFSLLTTSVCFFFFGGRKTKIRTTQSTTGQTQLNQQWRVMTLFLSLFLFSNPNIFKLTTTTKRDETTEAKRPNNKGLRSAYS